MLEAIRGLALEVVDREVVVEHGANLGGLGELGRYDKEAGERPMTMNGGVPVECAVERGMKVAMAVVARTGDDVVELVRILACDRRQCELSELRGLLDVHW